MKKKKDNEPIYMQIKNYLNSIIQQNLQNPKFRLPSENQLAAQFEVSRIPVIQAMRELEEEGKIKRIRGSGSFINTDYSKDKRPEIKFALLIPSIHSHYCLEMIGGIKKFLSIHNIKLHICITDDEPEQEKEYINSIRSLNFHGILLFPIFRGTYSNTILKLTVSKFPVVFISRNMPHLDVSSVLCKPYDQAYKAVEYLYNKGHKKIVFISENSKDDFFYDKRRSGFKSAMKFFYHNENPVIAEFDFFGKSDGNTKSLTKEKIVNFLKDNDDADAIIASNLANPAISQYIKQKDSSKKKLTVMVFDSVEEIEETNGHDLVLIDQSPYEIGYLAAEQLYLQIKENAAVKNITVTEKFIEKTV